MAGYTNLSKNAALTAIIATGKYISLHNADPGTTGVNEIVGAPYARVATTWGTVTAAAVTGSQVTLLLPNSVTIAFWGVWDALTGGNFWEGGPLPSSETYTGSGGSYLLTPTLTATG